ncbi:acyltransferase family protein [Streptomyces sp. NPDC086783]|uniref:acyltransferase family protein n=1 Tax=Streptomyces sp. NPDC086783 TaxID=3365758 RepID=UPI0038299A00
MTQTLPATQLVKGAKLKERQRLTAEIIPDRRNALFDNAKYLALVLVALGHAWEPLRSTHRSIEALYDAIYSFHMPVFIIVSGYFSQGFDGSLAKTRRLLTGVAVPYIVFEVAYTLFKRWAGNDPSYPISLLDPWYLTWFLIAIFIWRLSVPIWKSVRWPLSTALGIAALASACPSIGADLDLQRVLQFLPFFVLGLRLDVSHIHRLRSWHVRVGAAFILAGAIAVAYWEAPRFSSVWLYHRDSLQDLGYAPWSSPAVTLATFCCSTILAACFFALIPEHRVWFTPLGTGTLYGYLLHGFLIQGSRFWGWYDLPFIRQPLGVYVVTLIAAVAVTVLCSSPIRRAFRFVVDPQMAWVFKRDPIGLHS